MDEYPQNFEENNGGFKFSVFNTSDFSYIYNYATQYDLTKYANLYRTNFFFSDNFFQSLNSTVLNGVEFSVFQYLTNIKQDVQDGLNQIYNILYDKTTRTTLIYNDVITKSLGSLIFSSNNASISNTLNVFQVNSSLINSSKISSITLDSNKIKCNYLEFRNDIGLYLYVPIIIPNFGSSTTVSLTLFPIIKSQLVSNLFSTSPGLTSIYYIMYHIKPNYRIDIISQDLLVIYTFSNTTNDIIYNKNITIQNIYKINLYLNNILLT